ncbi:MAG TPA: DUF3017 domain-containing protein [Nocardioidaceae bacterium]|nr:DUF3017 domain-containing protein [Nocardioidaceae bacterium]
MSEAGPTEPPEPLPEPEVGRRYPSTLGGGLYLLALLGVAVGLVISVLDDWRVGVRWIGGALLFAALCRLLVPGREAGMLAVRNRFLDSVLLIGGGALLIFLATSIPNQPL